MLRVQSNWNPHTLLEELKIIQPISYKVKHIISLQHSNQSTLTLYTQEK